MEDRFWLREFGLTPSAVAGESAMRMARLRAVHAAACEGEAEKAKAAQS